METVKKNYRVKRSFSKLVHSPDKVELRKGVWNPILYTLNDHSASGKLAKIVVMLDGKHSLADIAKILGLKRSDIEGVLDQLRRINALEEGASNFIDYYIDEVQFPFPLKKMQENQRIVFIGDDEINQKIVSQLTSFFPDEQMKILDNNHPLQTILNQNAVDDLPDVIKFQRQIALLEEFKDALMVYTSRLVNPDKMLHFNRLAYEAGINWIQAVIDGPVMYIGPLFIAGMAPCYQCFEKRISMNIAEHTVYQNYKKLMLTCSKGPQRFVTPIIINLFVSHLSMEIINYVLTRHSYVINRVLSIYLPTMEIGYNELLRLPNCSVCGCVRERDCHTNHFDGQEILAEGVV